MLSSSTLLTPALLLAATLLASTATLLALASTSLIVLSVPGLLAAALRLATGLAGLPRVRSLLRPMLGLLQSLGVG